MDSTASFVRCGRAIDSAGGWVGGEGTGAGRGGGPPPTLLPTAFWERELGPGAELEGHSTLFSPLNPSVTCHMFVMNVERETAEAGKGGGSGEKKNS